MATLHEDLEARGAPVARVARHAGQLRLGRDDAVVAEVDACTRLRDRDDLAEVAHLLVPTTSLLDEYNQALWCALSGMVEASHIPPFKKPGVMVLAGFLWGQERYRYPNDLPKAGAKGGPQCAGLPKMPYGSAPPYVVADTGTNPWRRRYPGIVLNSDLIKQIMFGDTEHDGPPRNTAQIGQPG